MDSLVGHIGDITVVVVGGVLNVLGPAIGKSNRVATSDGAVGISGLGSVELGLGVVISNTMLIGIGSGHLLLSGVVGGGGSVVSRGSHGVGNYLSNNGSMVDNRGMDNGGGVVGSSVVDHGSVDNGGGVVGGSRSIRSRVGEGSGSVHGSDRLLVVSISRSIRSRVGEPM